MCCSISPVNMYLFLSLINLLRRYAHACARLTIVKLRVLCEQNSLRTEQRHSNLSQTLEHVEALTRSLKARKDTKDEKTTVERLLMEAELCKMLDEKREKLMKRDEEVAMEEERHREGVKAVLELKKKLKKEAAVEKGGVGASKGKEDEDDAFLSLKGDVVEEKDVLKAVSKKKEKSLDDFLNDEEEEDDSKSASTTSKTKYGEAALMKFEKQKKELLEKQKLAYEKAFRKK